MRQHKRTPISAGLTAFDLYTVLCNLHGCKRYTFLATGSLVIRRGQLTEFGDPPTASSGRTSVNSQLLLPTKRCNKDYEKDYHEGLEIS